MSCGPLLCVQVALSRPLTSHPAEYGPHCQVPQAAPVVQVRRQCMLIVT